jgi:hypothetical protein
MLQVLVVLCYYPFLNYGALLLPVSQWQMISDTWLAGWVACSATGLSLGPSAWPVGRRGGPATFAMYVCF